MAATDEHVGANEFISYVTKKNLNQIDLKTLESIRTTIDQRWQAKHDIKFNEALSLLDWFISIRRKQSSTFRAKEDRDYSILKS